MVCSWNIYVQYKALKAKHLAVLQMIEERVRHVQAVEDEISAKAVQLYGGKLIPRVIKPTQLGDVVQFPLQCPQA